MVVVVVILEVVLVSCGVCSDVGASVVVVVVVRRSVVKEVVAVVE